MALTSPYAKPSGAATKRIPTLSKGTESDISPVKRQKISKDHAAAGSKSTIHGNIYQLKLLTLFLRRGLNLNYSFALATEIVAAEKFDDIVFGYTNENGKDVCRFLQVKHKQDETKKIKLGDLLTEKDDDFSIKKYFISYCKIKRNPEFEGYYFQDFTICTNINLDENLANNFEEITGTDNILHFEHHEGFTRYKINLDRFSKKDELVSILRRTSELLRLANLLAVHVFKQECLELKDLFKDYHVVLVEKVIKRVNIGGIEVGKFHSEFINGESDPSSVLNRFRKSFHEEYQLVSKTQIDMDEFWVNMKEANLKISCNFGKKINLFRLDPNPQLTDPEQLAEKIAKAIKEADKNIVKILREPGKQGGIIKANIDKLGGYVFVKKEDESKKFHFNSEFLDEDEKLPDRLEQFRTKFIEKLENEEIKFSEMKEYEFHIANFMTFEEGQLYVKPSLPDDYVDDTDIKEFFERFVLSVNQPNEEKLGDIIQEEIGKDFTLIDSELMASKLQKDMLNWMKEKKGRFLTNEEGNLLFEEITQKVSKLVLIGPTLVYLAKIEQFQISFRDDLFALREFLNSEHEQIFNFISSCDDTIFSSIKVLQTLKNLDTYQTDDSFIYVRLNSLLYIRKHVMEAFSSGTSNLLAIECKAKKTEINSSKLCKQLSGLLKRDKNKKVILITLENDIFAEKFKKNFSGNHHYKEIKDKKISLTDLTDESGEKILMEGKVIFLGTEVTLNAVVDTESAHLLTGEVLSMLINNEKMEIGKAPVDSTHYDVEDYFIDRTFFHNAIIKTDFNEYGDFFIVDDNNKRDITSINQWSRDIVSIYDTSEVFEELCRKLTQHNIHWLKKSKNGNFMWRKSRGELTNLRKFVNVDWKIVHHPRQITDIPDRVVLLAAEPGMGKSVVLSHLALKTQSTSPSVWITRCNLNDYTKYFLKWKETGTIINALEAMKFLCEIANFQNFKYSEEDEERKNLIYRALTEENIEIHPTKTMKGLSLLEIELFVHFFHNDKVLLLFDGFDEISPDYKYLVVKLLTIFKDTKVKKMWLTTRSYNIQSELENQFNTFSYELMPFLEKDKSDFLKKFWRKTLNLENFDEERANVCILVLLYQLGNFTNYDQKVNFLSTPLQMYMIAILFSKIFKELYSSDSGELSLENKRTLAKIDLVTDLYEAFLNENFEIQERKLHRDYDHYRSQPTVNRDIERKRAKFMEEHEILAVYSIFKVDQFKKNLPEQELNVKKLIEDVREAEMKTGIIIRIVDHKPQFIHFTFAEYLVASYIWKKFVSSQLGEFEKDFIPDIINDILIKSAKIQVSRFLQLIAKKYAYDKGDFSEWKFKMHFLIKELANQINKIEKTQLTYCCSEKSVSPQDKEWYDMISPTINFQIIKLLLGIIEFSLQKRDEIYYSAINLEQSLELLCICAEMGYTKFAQKLMKNISTEHFKHHLSGVIWSYSPLWIAAQNHHLDIINLLVENSSYSTAWRDKYGTSLFESALKHLSYDVLKSCLEVSILDCGLTRSLDHMFYEVFELPIYIAIMKHAPPKVIELLIENTDVDLVNKFMHRRRKIPMCADMMILKLLTYDRRIEIMKLAMRKGFDFSFSMNICFSEFYATCFENPFFKLTRTSLRPIRLHLDNVFFEENFSNLFSIIELLLNSGVGYSCPDNSQLASSTYGYVRKIYYSHRFLDAVYNLHKQKSGGNCELRQIMLKLLLCYIKSVGFKGVKIVINPDKIFISPRYEDELPMLDSKRIIWKIINKVIKASNSMRGFELDSNDQILTVSFDQVMAGLFFEYYKDSDFARNLVKIALDGLNDFQIKKENKLAINNGFLNEKFKKAKEKFDNMNLLTGDIEEKKRRKEFFSKLVVNLECDALFRQIDFSFKIAPAVKEISENVLKFEKIIIKLLEMKKNLHHEEDNMMVLDYDNILEILDLKHIDCENVDLQQYLIPELDSYPNILDDLIRIYAQLNRLIEKTLMEAFEQMLKFSDQSTLIFELYEQLHDSYKNLIRAVVTNDRSDGDAVSSVLKNVKQDFVKAVINGLDEKYGSPLHYAAFKGQVENTSILLQNGANPNLRLCNNAEKIVYFPQAVEKMKKNPFLQNNFINWTPLYFAVLNGHQEIVLELMKYGAVVNPALDRRSQDNYTPVHTSVNGAVVNPVLDRLSEDSYTPLHSQDGYTPLHISALTCGHLEIVMLLLEKGALYNARNGEGKTPLDLATDGSDIHNLLYRIDRMFQTVTNGEKDAVNCLLEEIKVDWKAVLNARNTDGKTLLNLARDNKQEDIAELLIEKSRSIA